MCKTGRNGFLLLVLLLWLSPLGWSQDVPLAKNEIDRSLSLLTALELNWQQRETLSAEREKNLNEMQLSLQAREAFLNERGQQLDEREQLLTATESSLQKREQTQNEIESSLSRVQKDFETLEKASKKLERRYRFQRFLLRGSLVGLAGLGAFEIGRVLLK